MWRKWFPEHEIPASVEHMLRSGVLVDRTMRHDVVPHFEGVLGDRSTLVLWVDHPDPDRRHDPMSPRYGLEVYEKRGLPIDIMETDDLALMMETLKGQVRLRGGLRRL